MLAACGSSDTSHTTIDAPNVTAHDAPTTNPTPDAPMSAAAMGLGKVCDQTHMCPTTGATMCVKLSASATSGFCTLGCGTTTAPPAGTMAAPPAGGDAMCTASTPAPGAGTPACVLSNAPANNMIAWDCGILCGTSGTTNLGTCPSGLTCTMNICQ